MINRLQKLLRALPYCVGFCLLLQPGSSLVAQPDFFNFSYNGPSTLSVGPTCSSMLQGNVPDPVVSSSMGYNITMSMFDPVASGFQYSDLFTTGTIAHVFWFVKDDMGHSHTYEYFINFVDTSPPTFDLTGVFDTLEFSSIVQVPVQTALPAMDNCTPVVSDTFYQTITPDTCQSGSFTRTWMASDASNNTATYTQTIIIYPDTLPPLITGYPLSGSAPCTQLATAYPAWRALQIATFAATDASGVKSLINNAPVTFPSGCKVPLTVKFWAIDNCNIQQIVTVTFSTSDSKGPVVVKPPKDTVAYCSQSDNEMIKLREWISTKAYSQAFDSCSFPLSYSMEIGGVPKDSAQVIAAFFASFSGGCVTDTIGNQVFNQVHGFVSVDFFATDACSNRTFMGNADFGAIDTLPPTITGDNAIEQCGGGNDQTALQAWINAHGNAAVTEDCSDFTWTNFSFSTSNGQSGMGNFNLGPYPSVQANNCSWFTNVSFRATDDCGNSKTITLRWSIEDTLAPSITGLQPNITVYCPNPLPTVPAATVSDNCDANITTTFSRIYKDSLCDGSYTVLTTWTALDDCGNSSSATQNIFVSDTTRPVFTLVPANKTFRCDTFLLPAVPIMGMNITAMDVCSPVVSITTSTNSLQDPNPALCGHYSYDIIRVFTATDECGNTRTASQTLIVVDNLGPVPGGVLDTTTLCSALVPFPAPTPLATDACSGPTAPPTSSGQTTTAGACTDQYTITVHWSASDVCGNNTNFDQLVHVIDTVAPTILNIPANITVECDAIPAAPNNNSFNTADNCDNAVAVNLAESEIRDPDPTTCDHWSNYIVKREWTATDNCGNQRTYTQLIQIVDTTPPAIVPQSAMMFPNDLGDCGADVTLPAPLSVTDVCSMQLVGVVEEDTMFLVLSPEHIASSSADTVVFQMALPNASPLQPVVGPATLTIYIDEADAEGQQEFFKIFGENNTPLNSTNLTLGQCGSSTTVITLPANQLNSWINDGNLTLTLAPNNFNINLVPCANYLNRIRARIDYFYTSSDVSIELTYSLDGGASQNFPAAGPTFLQEGPHTVVYTATDCANNVSTASMQITVNDTQAPSMATPANITVYTGQNNCQGAATLPFPVITENCAMSASLTLASAILPLQFEDDPDQGIVAIDIAPTLSGLIPNAVGPGVLRIRHKGDNAQPGEFFNVYGVGGIPLGSTAQDSIQGECTVFFETVIPVTAADINNWAAGGGNTSFYLESNLVRNCAALLPNGTDGISMVQVILEYSYAVVNYTVKKPVNQTVASGSLTGNMTTVTLPPANYSVMYTTTDHAGLTGMTSFNLTVRDTVKPKAICQPVFIVQVDPSGGEPDTLMPASINNGSFDNCTPAPNLSYSVSPNIFNCDQANTTVQVTLTVTDTSGNSATCKSSVGITTTTPTPTYNAPVCENGTLQLFANPPSALPFSYQWSGPNNYSSNLQNPEVTTNAMGIHNGTYCVTITGATFCTSSACVLVNLATHGTTPVLTANGFNFCPGQNIVLATTPYPGQNVSYQWLMDTPSGLVILGTTSSTTVFTIPNPAPGTYTFYLKVYTNGCNTTLSNPLMVTMHPTPPADAEPEQQQVCEGFAINLNSPTDPAGGLTYSWTGGPSGFTSTLQNPQVTPSAVKSSHEGKYILVTQRNGCFSKPDTVMVNVTLKPATPILSGDAALCEGDTIKLVCNNHPNAAQYIWTLHPTNSTVFTSVNTLEIPNVTISNEGNYSLIVSANGCLSNESASFYVDIHKYPIITASSNAPICQDSLLKLTATFSSLESLSWAWTGPDNFMKFEQNPTQPNGATGLYQVIANTSNGCADTASVDVTNVMAPVIDSISNDAPMCCDGTSDATLSAIVSSSNLPLSYVWSGPPAFGSSGLHNPVIADVCTPYNGQYMLVVKDSFGCPSLPATTEINIQNPPATPTLLVNPAQPVCAGTNVLLSINNPTPGATYIWNRPAPLADTTTTTAWLSFPSSQPGSSGDYTVRAVSGNGTCQSGPSNTITLTINAIPPVPTISSNSPVCQGGTLTLFATPVTGASYMWTGPGFSTTQQNPERSPVTLSMAGTYTVKVTKDDCTSPETTLTVVVIPMPATPQIAQPPPRICIDRPPVGQFLNVLNPVNGMLYTWLDASTQIVLAGPSTASQLNLDSVLWLGPGTHTFRVISTTPLLADCNSAFSNVVTVDFDVIPTNVNAFAGLDRYACADSLINLSATPPTGIMTGLWSQIGLPAVTIVNPSQPSTFFVGEAGNIYLFQWSLSNGACTDFKKDTVKITAQNPELPNGGPDIYSCTTTGIKLQATQGMTAQGMWTQFPSQSQQLGIVIDEPLNPNTTISGLIGKGQTYAFYWEMGNQGCGFYSDPVVAYVYNGKPNAGPNDFVCSNDDCANLSASHIESYESGEWTSIPPGIYSFDPPNNPNTKVCGLKPGNNIFVWTTNLAVCGDQSRDTVEVYYEIFPTAENDFVPINFGSATQFDALANDILPNNFTVVVTIPPVNGTIVEPSTGVYIYKPNSGFTGTDVMTYRICNTSCPDACSFANVNFSVGGVPECFIPTIITPNNDGFNDEFKIPQECTLGEGGEELDVTIFNQWGDMVFHAKPYLNDWGGTYNTNELPAGTYFYVVKLNDADNPRTGFLLIQR